MMSCCPLSINLLLYNVKLLFLLWLLRISLAVSNPDDAKDSTAQDQGQVQGHSNVNVICRLCFSGENEGSERARKMLPCRSCGKKYHRNCLKTWSQHRGLSQNWRTN